MRRNQDLKAPSPYVIFVTSHARPMITDSQDELLEVGGDGYSVHLPESEQIHY